MIAVRPQVRGCFLGHRKRQSESRTLADPAALGPDASPVGFHDALADGQPQARTPLAAPLVVGGRAGVFAEQVRKLLRRHAPALIGYRDRHVRAVAQRGDPYRRGPDRVPRGVGEKIDQHLYDAPSVRHHAGEVAWKVDGDRVRGAAAQEGVPRLLHDHGYFARHRGYRKHARFDSANLEKVADQPVHLVRLLIDDPEEMVRLGRVRRRRCAEPDRGRPLDGGQRSAQFMAHQAQKRRPLPVQFVQGRQVLHRDHDRDDIAVIRSDRRSVEKHGDAPPVRHRQYDLLRAHGLRVHQALREGKLVERNLAPVRALALHHFQQVVHGLVRRAQTFHYPLGLPVDRHRSSQPRVDYHHTHRRRLHQCFEISARPPLVAMGARIVDGRCRLGGKQHQQLLVLAREVRSVRLFRNQETTHLLAVVEHRHRLKRLRRNQLREEAVLVHVVRQVRQLQRSRPVAQVRQQSWPVRPFHEPALLVDRESGGHKVAHHARLVKDNNYSVARIGKRAGAVNDLLQHGGEVQTRTDAQDRRAQLRDPRLGRINLRHGFSRHDRAAHAPARSSDDMLTAWFPGCPCVQLSSIPEKHTK